VRLSCGAAAAASQMLLEHRRFKDIPNKTLLDADVRNMFMAAGGRQVRAGRGGARRGRAGRGPGPALRCAHLHPRLRPVEFAAGG
jgi:hypothetical protein